MQINFEAKKLKEAKEYLGKLIYEEEEIEKENQEKKNPSLFKRLFSFLFK